MNKQLFGFFLLISVLSSWSCKKMETSLSATEEDALIKAFITKKAWMAKATPELIQILDSKDKGIIAHFILSEIWKETWNEQFCCNIMYKGKIEIFTVNGLKIYVENNVLQSDEFDLKTNKTHWKKLVIS